MPSAGLRQPNTRLAALLDHTGMSSSSLAARVNHRARRGGISVSYTHRSIANWRAGITPQPPIRRVIAEVLGDALGRFVPLSEIGFHAEDDDDQAGLHFPRDPAKAIAVATDFWSVMDRRALLTAGVAATAFTTPLCRWLTTDTDTALPGPVTPGRRVGRHDVEDLIATAQDARRADSRFGGGNWRVRMVDTCLTDRATPLLHGTYTDTTGRTLFAAVAELSQVAGWSAVDRGAHGLAQRHFIQGLRLARAAGDVPLGCYLLACMALQATLCDHHDIAIDMLDAATERGRGRATPRVLGFCQLVAARVFARSGDAPRALRALSAAETLLDRAESTDTGDDPRWIGFFGRTRLAADAVEIHRDLELPSRARTWNAHAGTNAAFTRSHSLRQVVLASTYLQGEADLDAALAHGHSALRGLAGIASARADGYFRDLADRFTPWATEPAVADFLHHARAA
ncbi:sporulation protein [Umezawaea sp. Da 62-37]|uniref:sporulation protein n=1 Tax=Umezawaea sp. Da 62-37 TaxID=3075927 RepID=UPI0028F73739|nr:sporulation protein [Umezawaea sp. Da 62-37]WNV86676.1 sporulation protein [Umezawaea sp. Da 62-37]WNV86741.1 sporulation protein [Umezawaea sp. Da 62-37]